MPRCEDYPCCGHTSEDPCPTYGSTSRNLPYECVECGRPIRPGTEARGHESFHVRCLNKFNNRLEDGYDPEDR